MGKNYIILKIGDEKILFYKDAAKAKYPNYVRLIADKQLNRATKYYCLETVDPDDLETLIDILNSNPGAALQISSYIADIVAPDLNIKII